MKSEKELQLAILSLGQAKILGAFKRYIPDQVMPTTNPNGVCAKALAACVAKGVLTLDDKIGRAHV